MPYNSKFIYRVPSVQEGVARIFDIPGRLKDDFTVMRVPNKRSRLDTRVSSDSLTYGVTRINQGADRINQTMGIVGERRRSLARKTPSES